jgi:hypothetical protein
MYVGLEVEDDETCAIRCLGEERRFCIYLLLCEGQREGGEALTAGSLMQDAMEVRWVLSSFAVWILCGVYRVLVDADVDVDVVAKARVVASSRYA